MLKTFWWRSGATFTSISFDLKDELLEPIQQSLGASLSSSARVSIFNCRRSGTASIINQALETADSISSNVLQTPKGASVDASASTWETSDGFSLSVALWLL